VRTHYLRIQTEIIFSMWSAGYDAERQKSNRNFTHETY